MNEIEPNRETIQSKIFNKYGNDKELSINFVQLMSFMKLIIFKLDDFPSMIEVALATIVVDQLY